MDGATGLSLTSADTDRPPIERRLENFDGFLERLAKEYGLATLDVVRRLPGETWDIVPGEAMVEILGDIGDWGKILFITEGAHVISGVSAVMPAVFEHDGYHHFFSPDGFGGHIACGACAHIAFIDRRFQQRRSLSIHFYDDTGEPMFKVFVSRELSGEMNPGQVERYFALRARLATANGS